MASIPAQHVRGHSAAPRFGAMHFDSRFGIPNAFGRSHYRPGDLEMQETNEPETHVTEAIDPTLVPTDPAHIARAGTVHHNPHPPQQEAPEPVDPREQLAALFGPNVCGYYAPDEELVRHGGLREAWAPGVRTDQVRDWIEQSGVSVAATAFPLYVNIHWRNALLRAVPGTAGAPEPPLPPLDSATAATLALPPPSHALTFQCDCAAPRARIDVYVLAGRRAGAQPPRTAPAPLANPGAQRPRGWHVYADEMRRGFSVDVRVPLLLDGGWEDDSSAAAGGNAPGASGVMPGGMPDSSAAPGAPANPANPAAVDLAVMIEALDNDGTPLLKPNAVTYYTRAALTRGASGDMHWEIGHVAGMAQMGAYVMQMHELYGFSSNAPKTTNAGDVSTESAGPDAELMAGAEQSDGTECVICMTLPPSTLILPCSHALCLECAVRVRESIEKSRQADRRHGRAPRMKYVCPICRGPIRSMLSLQKQA